MILDQLFYRLSIYLEKDCNPCAHIDRSCIWSCAFCKAPRHFEPRALLRLPRTSNWQVEVIDTNHILELLQIFTTPVNSPTKTRCDSCVARSTPCVSGIPGGDDYPGIPARKSSHARRSLLFRKEQLVEDMGCCMMINSF